MAQHTKGPWRYEQRGTQIWGRSVGGCRLEESDHLIADVRGWGHIQYLPNGKDVQDANGRLLAAAPCLLKLLKEARERIEQNINSLIESHTVPSTGLLEAEAVLAVEAEQDFLNQIDEVISKATT